MKTFKPGDYVRLDNDKIPAMIELLKVNGWHTEDWLWNSCAIWYNYSNVLTPINNPGVNAAITELSLHNFLITALRLKEGDGIRSDMSTPDQRKHIAQVLEKVGVNCHKETFPDLVEYYGFNLGVINDFWCLHDEFINQIGYTEWCKRLNVEPISEPEKLLDKENDIIIVGNCGRCKTEFHIHAERNILTIHDGSTVDLTKPIEVFRSDTNTWGKWYDSVVEVTPKGYAIISDDGDLFVYKGVRNKPEPQFKPGEWVWFRSSDSEPWNFGTIEETKDGSIAVNHQNHEHVSNIDIRPAFVDGNPVYPPFND